MKLRGYQADAINRLKQAFVKGWLAAILMAPTGAGKTAIARAIMIAALAKNNRIFFVVDSLELIDQAVDTFKSIQGDEWESLIGVMQADHPMSNPSAPIQVCSIQTLRGRWENLYHAYMPDLVIIDEAHVIHKAHKTIIDWCKANSVKVIGLTATPFRQGLGDLFDGVVRTITTRELIEQGYLVPFQAYSLFDPDMDGVKKTGGDFNINQLRQIMADKGVVGDIVQHWMRLAHNRRTLIFVPTRANSRELIEEFQKFGIAAAHVDGETPRQERDEIIQKFRNGEYQVLSNVMVLTKGFDAPECDCVILARPTLSLAMHIQMCGRGLRTAPGKADCLFLDHSGNLLRHGMPDRDLPTDLDGNDIAWGESNKPQKKEIACEGCGYLTAKVICPACEFDRSVLFQGPRQDRLEIINGELVQLPTKTQPDKKKAKPSPTKRLKPNDLYAEALWHARSTGKKDGWAIHFVKGITGQVPGNIGICQPRQPSAETKRLFKFWQIKASKSFQKQKQEGAVL